MQNTLSIQQENLNKRLPIIVGFLLLISAILLYRFASFQWLSPDVARELELRGEANYGSIRRLPAVRGLIYDRQGQPLAINTLQYEISASPNLITQERQIAIQLGAILNRDELELARLLELNVPWVQIARPVSAEVGQQIADLDLFGVLIEPLARRFYPQGALAGQVIGFTIEGEEGLQGVVGIEGYYNDQLQGRIVNQAVSVLPFELPSDLSNDTQRGKDIILTIDRDIQYWVEAELLLAINESGSTKGTIIVMDPRNGDILAMASYPQLDPNNFSEIKDQSLLKNAAVSEVYEPGSVMKVITVALGLEYGAITPDWTYNDQGVIELGGIRIQNWDRLAKGVVDTAQVLIQSLNIGATEIALALGPDNFYSGMRQFGFGEFLRVDLMGEEAGKVKSPGDPEWSDSDLGTNSFGQGIAVTPLQMITAVSALANDGLMYRPRVVRQIVDNDNLITVQPSVLKRPVSAETANFLAETMKRVVEEGATKAQLPGYSIAGKTGTAQIPSPVGYESGASIVTFVGFFPSDDPQVAILVKLDRPVGYWGSEVAAPVFKRLAERLVLLLEIPPDELRYALASEGGVINNR